MRTTLALIQLALALGLAKIRASRATSIAGDVLAGWGSALLAACGALFFAWVGAALLVILVGRGEIDLACHAASAVANLTCALAAIAAVIAGTARPGIDPRPLALLPLPHTVIGAIALLSNLFASATALVIWPAGVALLIGAAAAGGTTALLLAPVVAALVLAAAAIAVVAGAYLAPARAGAQWIVRAIAASIPLLWIVSPASPFAPQARPPEAGFTPGSWVGAAFRLAIAGDPRALLAAAALGVLALAAMGLAAPRLARSRFEAATSAGGREWFLPASLQRVWGPPRAASLLAQAMTTSLLIAIFHAALEARAAIPPGLVPMIALVIAWLLAAAPAPLFAGALGIGGPAAALAFTSAERPALELARTLAIAAAPSFATIVLWCAWLALLGRTEAALLACAGGFAALAAGAGAGAVASVLAPGPLVLARAGDPLWHHGAARFAVPLVQTLVLSPVAATVLLPSRASETARAAMIAAMLGFAMLAAGLAIARRMIARDDASIAEALGR